MNDLKPCPFCGGEAESRKTNLYMDKAYIVECKCCHGRTEFIVADHPRLTPSGLDESTRYMEEQAQQRAISLWNRRVIYNDQRTTA